LSGNGKLNSDRQGHGSIQTGDRIGVLVDLEELDGGFVRFFVNGQSFGNGFREGAGGAAVKAPLTLGVQMAAGGQAATIHFSNRTKGS
jgi:hypothetical protein